MINRRSLITGLISLVAAPAIVRVANIMPVKQMLTLDIADVEWAVMPPNANWHLSFWCSGRDWKMGDVVEMHGQRFAVDGIETMTNGTTGRVWHHVTGKGI